MRFTPLAALGEEPLSGVMVKVLEAAGLYASSKTR